MPLEHILQGRRPTRLANLPKSFAKEVVSGCWPMPDSMSRPCSLLVNSCLFLFLSVGDVFQQVRGPAVAAADRACRPAVTSLQPQPGRTFNREVQGKDYPCPQTY